MHMLVERVRTELPWCFGKMATMHLYPFPSKLGRAVAAHAEVNNYPRHFTCLPHYLTCHITYLPHWCMFFKPVGFETTSVSNWPSLGHHIANETTSAAEAWRFPCSYMAWVYPRGQFCHGFWTTKLFVLLEEIKMEGWDMDGIDGMEKLLDTSMQQRPEADGSSQLGSTPDP